MIYTLYSTTACPYCKSLKDYLNDKKIEFNEKLIDQNENYKLEMEKESQGFLGVPFSVIIKNDNTKETIIGFDKGKLETILK